MEIQLIVYGQVHARVSLQHSQHHFQILGFQHFAPRCRRLRRLPQGSTKQGVVIGDQENGHDLIIVIRAEFVAYSQDSSKITGSKQRGLVGRIRLTHHPA